MDNTWMETAWLDVVRKIERISHRINAGFPNGSVNGLYQLATAHDWIAGFWPGMLWTVYEETGNDRLKELAVQCEQKISFTLWENFEQLHHDVGFMFELSSIKQYKLIHDEEARRHGLMAANLLAGRFNPAGGFIRAWPNWGDEDHTGWAIIDCMMNLPLLYWASKELADPRYQHIAELHADTVLREFIRADGSVRHIVRFDPNSGKRIEALAGQGYSADSAWSRGAAWALYGFVLSYKYTGRARYLTAAQKVAKFYLDHLPEDLVPYWDFRLPQSALGNMPRDSSAAAIAAAGLLELAEVMGPADGDDFKHAAEAIIKSLYENYAAWDTEEEGILLHATGYYDREIYVDQPLIYGDYYFVKALKLLKNS